MKQGTANAANSLDVASICTKFFYQEHQLCFQIILSASDGGVWYKNFFDYHDYQTKHDQIVEALNQKKEALFSKGFLGGFLPAVIPGF